MTNIWKVGFFYFLGVFTLGFIFGALRIFFLIPYTGSVIAVLIEIPFMLVFAWFFCRFLTRRYDIPNETNDRLAMGILAFGLLMVGEALITVVLQAGRMTDFFTMFDLPENRIGLGSQIAFALFPVIQSYGQAKTKR